MPWYADLEELRREVERRVQACPDTIDSLKRGRRIVLLAECSPFGLIHADGCATPHMLLPVNLGLIGRMMAWQGRFEDLKDKQDECDLPLPGPDFQKPSQLWNESSDEGRALAAELKRQLPDWTVEFFDDHHWFLFLHEAEGGRWVNRDDRHYMVDKQVMKSGEGPLPLPAVGLFQPSPK